MPQLKFNWVDVIFVTLLIRISYIAYKNGLMPEFFKLFGLIIALVLSATNYTCLSSHLSRWVKGENNADMISLGLIFLGSLLLFKILDVFISFLIKSESVPELNRLIGLFLGIIRAALLMSILLITALFSPGEYFKKSVHEKSIFSPYILKVAPLTYKFAIKFYPGVEPENPFIEFLNKP